MNDEIKEILEALRDSIDDTGTDKVNFINWINKIEDYITNLQHQISLMEEDNGELRQEISRLTGNIYNTKEYIEKHRIREKCIIDVNTLEDLLNER